MGSYLADPLFTLRLSYSGQYLCVMMFARVYWTPLWTDLTPVFRFSSPVLPQPCAFPSNVPILMYCPPSESERWYRLLTMGLHRFPIPRRDLPPIWPHLDDGVHIPRRPSDLLSAAHEEPPWPIRWGGGARGHSAWVPWKEVEFGIFSLNSFPPRPGSAQPTEAYSPKSSPEARVAWGGAAPTASSRGPSRRTSRGTPVAPCSPDRRGLCP